MGGGKTANRKQPYLSALSIRPSPEPVSNAAPSDQCNCTAATASIASIASTDSSEMDHQWGKVL